VRNDRTCAESVDAKGTARDATVIFSPLRL
jgi:hypothetical protein